MLTQGDFRAFCTATALALAVGVGGPTPSAAQAATNPWDTRDPATIAPADALYFLAGSSYGDPSAPVTTTGQLVYSSAQPNHLTRPTSNIETLQQALQAVESIGGSGFIEAKSTTKSRLEFDLPVGSSYVLDLSGVVLVDGQEAFGLAPSGSGWTSTATGTQVRAFLAGFMEGEGNHDGKVGDDPSRAHLAFVQQLMATPQAYEVPTDLLGRAYFQLYVHDSADDPKVQAYPFIVYGRCPGGRPR